MFWTANVSAIADLEQNWALLEAQMDLAGGRAKFKPMLGIYMCDSGLRFLWPETRS